MKLTRDGILLIALFIALLVGGYFLAAQPSREESRLSTSYSADRVGVKAFYTLLGERLGYRAKRLEKPFSRMPPGSRVLICVQPVELKIGPAEEYELGRWIESGGIAIFLSDRFRGIPVRFRRSGPRGNGAVYAFANRLPITNEGMRSYRNAVKLLQIIAAHAGPRDLIVFDEYHHGIIEPDSVFPPLGRQVKIALWMLAAVALLMCLSFGRRFGAVRSLPDSRAPRPAIEFVDAVAQLYRRAAASDVVARVLCDSFRRKLTRKEGLPVDAGSDEITRRLGAGELAARVREVLAGCERAGERPTGSELQGIAARIASLEEEFGIAD